MVTIRLLPEFLEAVKWFEGVLLCGGGDSVKTVQPIDEFMTLTLNNVRWRLNIQEWCPNSVTLFCHLRQVIDDHLKHGNDLGKFYYLSKWDNKRYGLQFIDKLIWTSTTISNVILTETKLPIVLAGFDLPGKYSDQARHFHYLNEKHPGRLFRIRDDQEQLDFIPTWRQDG